MRIPAALLLPKHKVDQLLCHDHISLLEALAQIDSNGKGVLFVVDIEQHFCATLTEGDIRRAILARRGLDISVALLIEGKTSLSLPIGTALTELVACIGPGLRIIPLLDESRRVVDYFELKASFNAPIAATHLGGNELAYVLECVTTNWISSQGAYIPRFENLFSNFIGVEHGIAVMNGTVAIHLALVALGIQPGDEVIIPDLTFAATINPVLLVGAIPVIVDVESDSWCIDPLKVEEAITSKTKAIIPVHLYGQPCNMAEIMRIANQYGLKVIEDCAEAHGASFEGKRVGSFGDVSCFSFFANKIVTTGEGGMCLTRNATLADRMRRLRDHGMSKEKRYWHDEMGFNYRMTNLQAAVGVAQMERVEALLESRENIRKWYDFGFSDLISIERQLRIPGRKSVNWLYSCLLKGGLEMRNQLTLQLKEAGIDLRPFFYPLSSMPVYSQYAKSPTLIAHDLSNRGINLPTLLSFSENEYQVIIDQVKAILSSHSSLEGIPSWTMGTKASGSVK